MMNKKNYLLAFLLIGSLTFLRGQVFLPSKHVEKKPLVLILTQDSIYKNVLDSCLQLNQNRQVSIVVSSPKKENLSKTIDLVNNLLNQDSIAINSSSIYLGVIGDSSFFKSHNRFELGIFPAKFFINTDVTNFQAKGFYNYHWDKLNLLIIYDRIKTHYLWGLDKIDHLKTVEEHSPEPEKHWGLGMSITQYRPNYNINIDQDNPYNNYGFNFFYKFNKNWTLDGGVSASLKKADLKRSIRSQINPADIQAGNEITLDLNEKVEIRIHFQSSIDLKRYLWKHKSGLRLYSSTGISHFLINQGSTIVDTTVIIDPTQLQSSGANSFDQDKLNNSFQLTQINTIAVPLNLGIELHSSKHALLNLKSSYLLSKPFSKELNNSFSIQFGLSFKIYKKENKYLEYLRLK